MRACARCCIEMIEGFDIKVVGGAYGIKISRSKSIFSKRIAKPKVAICPQCGEVSLYIDNVKAIPK